MSQVEPCFKDNLGDCGCGCGLYGRLKKPNKAGVRCVANRCKCKSCQGRKNRNNGHKKQNKGARALGLVTSKFAPSDEENLGGHLRFEHKSGAHDAGPIRTRYEACRAQSDAARSIGDVRPFVAGFTPPGSRLMYVVVRSDDLEAFVLADAYVRGFIP